MNYATRAPEQVGRMTTETKRPQVIQPSLTARPQQVRPTQAKPQQAQPQQTDRVTIPSAQFQQMQAQMAAMQAQLLAQEQAQRQQPVIKTYSIGQIQILLSCETINSVLEEFDLSEQKKVRLAAARDYLLSLGDLSEFIKEPETVERSTDQSEEPVIPEEDFLDPSPKLYTDEEFFEEEIRSGTAGETGSAGVYQGQPEKTVTDEIAKINQKMAELKQEEAKTDKAKSMTGLEKIKSFISRKNTPETAAEPKDYEGIPEGMG